MSGTGRTERGRGRGGRGRERGQGPARFQAERRVLRKIQVHFELEQSLMRKVRMAAAKQNLSTSDYVRRIVGLPYAKIQRPRISLSFGDRDLELLAERYDRPSADRGALRHRVMDEIRAHFDAETDAEAAVPGPDPRRERRGG